MPEIDDIWPSAAVGAREKLALHKLLLFPSGDLNEIVLLAATVVNEVMRQSLVPGEQVSRILVRQLQVAC